MTPLLKEPEQQDDGNALSEPGRLSLLADFRVTLTDFWGQTVSPAARMLSQTVSILWKQALIPALQNWLTSTRDRLAWTARKRPKAPTMELQTPSELAVMKIHGALGERWTSDTEDRPIRVNMGKQNPWIAAEKKISTLQPTAAEPKKVVKTASVTSKDEIKGLDDIFTGPVQGSFVDVLKKPGRSEKPQRNPIKEIATAPAAEKTAMQPPPQTIQALQDLQAEAEMAAFQESARMQALARTQEALREESRHLGSRVKRIAESTKDWFAKNDFALEDEAGLQPPPLYSAVSFTAYVDEETVVASAPELKPIEAPLSKLQSQPLMSRPASRAVKAKPPELTYELAEDLSGFDYMIQNNRILSNSISNLVDGYFTQAALEEEPNYY